METQAILQTPTPDFSKSLEFYRKLGFKAVKDQDDLLTDGKVFVRINQDRFARAGIVLYREDWGDVLEKILSLTHLIPTDDGYLLADASGVWIYLVSGKLDTDLQVQEEGYSVLGNFAGLSLETVDLAKSAAIYQALGFKLNGGSVESGFASFSLSGLTVTLMKPLVCPHLFFNPSMTYFNGKEGNPEIIAKIRTLQIPITEEITHFNKEGKVDNIIIRDPGGFGFFLFND